MSEVGVGTGRNAGHLLKKEPRLGCLTLVDPWSSEYAEGWLRRKGLFQAELKGCRAEQRYHIAMGNIAGYRKKVEVLRMPSMAGALHVEDGSQDLVFIDGDHRYEGVHNDIQAWLPKVRPGGIICGHDYGQPTPEWGVKEAVDEAFGSRVVVARNYVWWVRCE